MSRTFFVECAFLSFYRLTFCIKDEKLFWTHLKKSKNSILLGILRRVFRRYFSQKLKVAVANAFNDEKSKTKLLEKVKLRSLNI